jgi:methionine-rich copper-binding protein CopC
MTTSRIRTLTLAATFAALALSTLAVLSPIAPSASAHDELVSTTPAQGEHLADPPSDVSMVFSDKLIEVGAVILVVDEKGKNWVDGDVRLDGATATAPLDPTLPDGNYQVRWRVVSTDGHPISGTFDFSTGTATQPPATPSGEPGAPGASRASDSGLPLLAVGAIGAAVGLVVLAALLLLRRRKKLS